MAIVTVADEKFLVRCENREVGIEVPVPAFIPRAVDDDAFSALRAIVRLGNNYVSDRLLPTGGPGALLRLPGGNREKQAARLRMVRSRSTTMPRQPGCSTWLSARVRYRSFATNRAAASLGGHGSHACIPSSSGNGSCSNGASLI